MWVLVVRLPDIEAFLNMVRSIWNIHSKPFLWNKNRCQEGGPVRWRTCALANPRSTKVSLKNRASDVLKGLITIVVSFCVFLILWWCFLAVGNSMLARWHEAWARWMNRSVSSVTSFIFVISAWNNPSSQVLSETDSPVPIPIPPRTCRSVSTRSRFH